MQHMKSPSSAQHNTTVGSIQPSMQKTYGILPCSSPSLQQCLIPGRIILGVAGSLQRNSHEVGWSEEGLEVETDSFPQLSCTSGIGTRRIWS